MSDTSKTPESATNRRRADDWKKPSSVPRPDVFDWAAEPGVVVMEAPAVARVAAALSGARALLGVLFQHEMDRSADDDSDSVLRLKEATLHGLYDALASCIEVAETHAQGGRAIWTTRTHEGDAAEAEHIMRATRDASISMHDRRAVEHAERLNKGKAARRGAA
ncbi:MAG: hypothetical protein RLZZ555_519 [Pseudomonadota bacterium]|jgi:hypothetical protein